MDKTWTWFREMSWSYITPFLLGSYFSFDIFSSISAFNRFNQVLFELMVWFRGQTDLAILNEVVTGKLHKLSSRNVSVEYPSMTYVTIRLKKGSKFNSIRNRNSKSHPYIHKYQKLSAHVVPKHQTDSLLRW